MILASGTGSLVLLGACQSAAAPVGSACRDVSPTRRPHRGANRAGTADHAGAGNIGATSRDGRPGRGPVEPKGKFSYAFHTTIPPSWLDPQENPPQVTPYNFSYMLHDALVKPMPGQELRAEPGRVVRDRAGLQVGDLQAAPGHQVP